MSQIHVLQILPDFSTGGAERMAVNLMLALDRSRYRVTAVSLYAPRHNELEKELAVHGIPLRFLGKRPGPDLRVAFRLAGVIEELKPDLIHTHRYVLRYLIPVIYRKSVPIVHTVHSVADREVSRLGQRVHRWAYRRNVKPVSIAHEVTASLKRVYGLKDCAFIPNGIPVETYQRPRTDRQNWREQEGFSSNALLFVCVARLNTAKNHPLLVKAFAEGTAGFDDAHLLLVGDGPLREEIEQLVEQYALSHRVRFLGNRNDVADILAAADVFALASDWEGNPLSVMEAMAAGKPVLSTAVGGVPELVEDGRTGILTPKGDVTGLASAMKELIDNPDRRLAMGMQGARKAMECFDVCGMGRSYENLYDQIVSP
jgi:glycosyltransferase involved in cell wall biosynthesis